MGNLLTYSGLTTKVRAMESRFLTKQQFSELAALSTVGEALDFIKSQPAYADLLAGADSTIHRSDLEKLLIYPGTAILRSCTVSPARNRENS